LKVLYIHMIGAFGGASRSLTEAVGAFPAGSVEPHFVTAAGSVEPFFARLGPVQTARGISQFDNTRYSHYRGLRWLVALRELAYLPATVLALRRARRRWGNFDLIHVNEFTGIVPWWLARRWFGAPVVVHVRSVARSDARSLRTRLVNWMLRQRAEAVVAIDETVRGSLPADLPVSVIHNAFTPHRVAADAPPLAIPAALRPGWFRVGFVGNLLKVKGIHELVAAAAIVRDRGLQVEFVVVGDDAAPSRGLKARLLRQLGLGQNAKAEVMDEIGRLGLADRFHMLGFTQRIAEAYGLMDVLCFPSHFDAPGRPVFEAAFAGKPAIVCLSDPKPDTLVHGVTGLAIPARDPVALADAIERLCGDPTLVKAMGEAAAEMAHRTFDPQRNAADLLTVYRRITSGSPSQSGSAAIAASSATTR
jgi:glycosyltransferase involved in cell wall biosynthesis